MTPEQYYQMDRPLVDELKAIEERLYQKSKTGSAHTDNEEFNSILRKQQALFMKRAELIETYLSAQS